MWRQFQDQQLCRLIRCCVSQWRKTVFTSRPGYKPLRQSVACQNYLTFSHLFDKAYDMFCLGTSVVRMECSLGGWTFHPTPLWNWHWGSLALLSQALFILLSTKRPLFCGSVQPTVPFSVFDVMNHLNSGNQDEIMMAGLWVWPFGTHIKSFAFRCGPNTTMCTFICIKNTEHLTL